jgi:hypothetical protein
MRSADGLGVGAVRDEHPGPNHIARPGAHFGQGSKDDFEASPRLDLCIRVATAIGPDGGRARDHNAVAHSYSSAEAKGVLVRRDGSNVLAFDGHAQMMPDCYLQPGG